MARTSASRGKKGYNPPSGKKPVFKMMGSSPVRQDDDPTTPTTPSIEFPMTKPSKRDIIAAASDPKHPMSIESVGHEAHYAWKAGGRPIPKKPPSDTVHGAGGNIENPDGSINLERTAAQLGITVAELKERRNIG